MAFKNRIRLPMYATQAQFPSEATRFRKANGVAVTLSVVIRKTYQLKTDWMSEKLHQRVVAALNHDDVTIEGDRYIGGIAVDGTYEIEWQDFLDYPLGRGEVQLQVTPFDMTNDNCKSCEEVSQLSLVDDDAGTVSENTVEQVDVISNDTICCSPVQFEVTWWNPTYVDSAAPDLVTGQVTLTMKATTPSSGVSVKLATYRITCPDGTYDEADVYGEVTGSLTLCEAPTFPDPVIFTLDGGVTIDWTGTGNFEWQIYECDNLGSLLDSGTVASPQKVFAPGELNPGQCYHFCARKDCGGGDFSEWECVEFTIPVPASTCGRFTITADDGTTDKNVYPFSYMDCAGVIKNSVVVNLGERVFCFLMNPVDNTPVYFAAGEFVTYVYTEPC